MIFTGHKTRSLIECGTFGKWGLQYGSNTFDSPAFAGYNKARFVWGPVTNTFGLDENYLWYSPWADFSDIMGDLLNKTPSNFRCLVR